MGRGRRISNRPVINVRHWTIPTIAGNDQVYNALIVATQKSGATVFHTGRHDFFPQGMSAFVILGESHTAVHTYPEYAMAWVEIASCGNHIDPDTFIREFSALVIGGREPADAESLSTQGIGDDGRGHPDGVPLSHSE